VSREGGDEAGAVRRARRPVYLFAAGLALVAGVYGVALGTTLGLEADSRAILDSRTGRPWAAHWAVADLVHTLAAASFGALALVIAVLAFERSNPRRVLAALALIGGASVTAQMLKPILGALSLFSGGTEHRLESSFPSGHAASAMALGLALVWTAPVAWRRHAALLASSYSVAIGVALLVLGWHYPSDIVGGYLVAGAWAAGIVMAVGTGPIRVPFTRRRGGGRRLGPRWPSVLLLGVLSVAVVLGLAVPAIALTHLAPHGSAPPAFLAGAAAVALSAAIVIAANAALARDPTSIVAPAPG
jgi:membrane-associated phospholipid phosphatase